MLPARVFAPPPPSPTQEDIFASSLSILFTDDTQNSHGLPGHSVIYTSPTFGDVTLNIPEHPDAERGRLLFAHYLWNAGVVVADAVEIASNRNANTNESTAVEGKVSWNRQYWDVRDQDVLELGAGTALPSLISGLCGARSLTITDHPSSPALTMDTIAKNVQENLRIQPEASASSTSGSHAENVSTEQEIKHADADTETSSSSPLMFTRTPLQLPQDRCQNVSIHGLVWGTSVFKSSMAHGKPSSPQPEHSSFDKIIIADCLWLSAQHANIVKTINTYLRQPPTTGTAVSAPENVPCALVVAGFHTGRAIVARFFKIATGSGTGQRKISSINRLGDDEDGEKEKDEEEDVDDDAKEVQGTLHAAEIFEVDVDCNVREWLPERPGESREQAKKWCVCAALVR